MAIRSAVYVTILICAVAGVLVLGAERSRHIDRICAAQPTCPSTDADGHMRGAP